MKPSIAWITYDLPYPPNSGGKHRAFNLIKYLSRDFDIHLFSFYRNEKQLLYLDELKLFASQIHVYKRRSVWDLRNLLLNTLHPMPLLNLSYRDNTLKRDLVKSALNGQFQLYHFEFLGAADYMPDIKKAGGRVLMGNENVEYKIYAAYTKNSKFRPLVPFYKYDVWKMGKFERKLWKLADENIAVCGDDASEVMSVSGRPCHVVPNGVEIKPNYPLSHSASPVAFFSGNLNYQQNRNAVLWFMENVFPLVRKEIPEFKLVVLSNSRPGFANDYGYGLEILGDERTTFDMLSPKACVFVSPIWIKSGTNIKVLQAASCGLPIVGTSASLTGYDFENEKDVLICDTPDTFAQGVTRIIGDVKLQQRLSSGAFEKVKKYSWENSARILKDVYSKILS